MNLKLAMPLLNISIKSRTALVTILNDARKDSAHFTSFKQKYLRAVRIKERGTARNKLIKRAVALALEKGYRI